MFITKDAHGPVIYFDDKENAALAHSYATMTNVVVGLQEASITDYGPLFKNAKLALRGVILSMFSQREAAKILGEDDT